MSTAERAALAAVKVNQRKEMRTCCHCLHIKCGIVILGLIELIAIALILSGILTQIINKNRKFNCDHEFISRLFRDCNLLTFDWTLAGDYFIALLLFSIAICVLLLFLGILIKSPFLLLPHLLIQGVFLISSLAYFFLYARSYFYIDLYKQSKTFDLTALLERMWLATLLLILAAFQFYTFFNVIKCCLYLQEYQKERLRRIGQFEECSKRVRDAKKNGLWRYTSWGGGFQQYVGEHDSNNHKLKKRNKPPGHVQWNLQANIELAESKNTSNPMETTKQLKKIKDDKKVRNISVGSNYHDEDKRRTTGLVLSPINKERVDKQLLTAVPMQPVKPNVRTISGIMKAATSATITVPTKGKESPGDAIPVLLNPVEQYKNTEKKYA
ncbi:putative integral membrane protein [Acanthocheilonema viteae]